MFDVAVCMFLVVREKRMSGSDVGLCSRPFMNGLSRVSAHRDRLCNCCCGIELHRSRQFISQSFQVEPTLQH